MAASTVTSKGQITIPKEIRDQVKLRVGQRVLFHVDPKGRVILTPQVRDVMSLKGMLYRKGRRAVTIEEMNEAIASGFAGE